MKTLEQRFGEILKRIRNEKGLSQETLGLEAELDRTYISMLERGLRQPSIGALISISKALGVSASSIVKELEK